MLTIIPNFKIIITIAILSSTLVLIVAGYYIYLYYNLNQNYKKQNIKAINLFLDKKLVSKLLEKIVGINSQVELDIIVDDIINYFGIEFAALKVRDLRKILRFNNHYSHHIISDKET